MMIDEIKKPEEEKKPEEKKLSKLEKAEKVLAEMQDTTDKYEKLSKENQDLASRNLLGGETDAGIQPDKPKEETDKEYAERVMRGELGIDKANAQ